MPKTNPEQKNPIGKIYAFFEIVWTFFETIRQKMQKNLRITLCKPQRFYFQL